MSDYWWDDPEVGFWYWTEEDGGDDPGPDCLVPIIEAVRAS